MPRPAEFDALFPRLVALEKKLGVPRQPLTPEQLDMLAMAAEARALLPKARALLRRRPGGTPSPAPKTPRPDAPTA